MEHCAINDALTEIGRIAAAGEKRDISREYTPLIIKACLPIDAEIMALAGEHHVVVAIKPELAGFAGETRAKCGNRRPLRGLALLAAKAAAHAPDLAGDIRVGNAENPRHNVLNFGRVLRRGMNQHFRIFARNGERNLPFEIKMLLTANPEHILQTVRRLCNPRCNVAAAIGVIGQDRLVALDGMLDRNARRLGRDVRLDKTNGAARFVPCLRDNGKEHLANEFDAMLGKHRVIAHCRRNVIHARNIRGRINSNHAGRSSDG